MGMEECLASITEISDSDFNYTLSLIGGKYKMLIMFWIAECEVIRYNELKRKVGSISHKTLSLTLKELEHDKIITRTEYPQVPPKVEYRLSERGKSLIPILDMICAWGGKNRISKNTV